MNGDDFLTSGADNLSRFMGQGEITMYRIMVVDDEDYILKALNRVLATRPDWEVETLYVQYR